MKVCPECGYIDRSHWRQNRWRTNVEFLPAIEFKEEHQGLYQKLTDGHRFVKDKLYAYQRSGKVMKVVERVILQDFLVGGKSTFHIPRERHKPMDPYQQKIGGKSKCPPP